MLQSWLVMFWLHGAYTRYMKIFIMLRIFWVNDVQDKYLDSIQGRGGGRLLASRIIECCCYFQQLILALTLQHIQNLLGNFIELQVNNNNRSVECSSRYQTFVRRIFSSIICGIPLNEYHINIIIIISMLYSLFVFLEISVLFTCQIQRCRRFRARIGKVPWEWIVPKPHLSPQPHNTQIVLESFNAYVWASFCLSLSLFHSLSLSLSLGVVEW